MSDACGYMRCANPAEVTVEWIDDGEQIAYCSMHARELQSEWGDVTEVVDD